MEIVNLNSEWSDFHTLFSFDAGSAIVIHNISVSNVYVYVGAMSPVLEGNIISNKTGYKIESGGTYVIRPAEETTWIYGNGFITGDLIRKASVNPYTVTDLPNDVWTSTEEYFRRLRVDVAQTGLFEGREFRMVRKVSVTAGTPLIFRFTSAVDFILFEQSLNCSEGDLEYYVFRSTQGVAGGSWTPLPVTPIGKNISSTFREYGGLRYATQVALDSGGTFTPTNVEQYVDYDRAKTSGATAQQLSVSGGNDSVRLLAAGQYYLILTSLVGTSVGRFNIAWEERPDSFAA